jgi:hypothetical protein
MGRPSFSRRAVTMKDRQLVAATISGDVIFITEGTIEA